MYGRHGLSARLQRPQVVKFLLHLLLISDLEHSEAGQSISQRWSQSTIIQIPMDYI